MAPSARWGTGGLMIRGMKSEIVRLHTGGQDAVVDINVDNPDRQVRLSFLTG